jgi:large subunit ribosomal protein L14e
VDGPSDDESQIVPRHAAPLSKMSLTAIVIPKLPRGAGTGALKKQWDEHKVLEKWQASGFQKSREQSIRRRQLSDFERFKVMKLRKQVRVVVRLGGVIVLC